MNLVPNEIFYELFEKIVSEMNNIEDFDREAAEIEPTYQIDAPADVRL